MVNHTASVSTSRPPSLDDVRFGLGHILGDQFPAVWESVCAQAGIGPAAGEIAPEQFDHLLEVLADKGPLCRVLALSWKIRRTAARKLAELQR